MSVACCVVVLCCAVVFCIGLFCLTFVSFTPGWTFSFWLRFDTFKTVTDGHYLFPVVSIDGFLEISRKSDEDILEFKMFKNKERHRYVLGGTV